MKYVSALFIGIMIATYSFASQNIPEKKEYAFYIMISSGNDNPTKTGIWPRFDDSDRHGCNILNLSWPEKDEAKIWRIETTKHTKTGDNRNYAALMPISDFSDTVEQNPHVNKACDLDFIFPATLSDDVVKELVKEKILTRQLSNGTKIHLCLQNSPESLEKLGLTNQYPGLINQYPRSFIACLFALGAVGIACLLYLRR